MNKMKSFFIFDVESIGLHGEGFAVAGGVYLENGAAQKEFKFCCPSEQVEGFESNRKWVQENVPVMEITHRSTKALRDAFWVEWVNAQKVGAQAAAECLWPVEARFMIACIGDVPFDRQWQGPYPFHEISSIMMAAGMDPMGTYDRTASEMPAHDPLSDARLSARLLSEALSILKTREQGAECFFAELP